MIKYYGFRSVKFLVFFLLIVLVTILLADTLVVKVKTTHVRTKPVFYASSVAVLRAGDSVQTLSLQNGWYKVITKNGKEGWLHSSALGKGVTISAMDQSLKSGATADEVALASKGFNKQVEDEFKLKRGDLSFVWVERMLKIKITPEQLRAFLENGKLGEFGGAL